MGLDTKIDVKIMSAEFKSALQDLTAVTHPSQPSFDRMDPESGLQKKSHYRVRFLFHMQTSLFCSFSNACF